MRDSQDVRSRVADWFASASDAHNAIVREHIRRGAPPAGGEAGSTAMGEIRDSAYKARLAEAMAVVDTLRMVLEYIDQAPDRG